MKWATEHNRRRDERDQARAEVARLTGELDAARARTEGGEWQWGVRCVGTEDAWCGNLLMARLLVIDHEDSGAHLIRRWTGPVEPVTDGEAAP
jgi:hypothetical protein